MATQNDLRVTLLNNILGHKVGDEGFMIIVELHSGYNRLYQLADCNGTRKLTEPLPMNLMADVVDGLLS